MQLHIVLLRVHLHAQTRTSTLPIDHHGPQQKHKLVDDPLQRLFDRHVRLFNSSQCPRVHPRAPAPPHSRDDTHQCQHNHKQRLATQLVVAVQRETISSNVQSYVVELADYAGYLPLLLLL